MSFLRFRFLHLYRFAALLAMLVPMGVMLVHQPVGAQGAVRICDMGNMGKDGGSKSTPKMPHCPICQSLHFLGGGFVPPDVVAIATVSFVVRVPISMAFDVIPTVLFISHAQPRAPPVLV